MKSRELDWFEPLMQSSLHTGFDKLICIEESKLQLARCLKQLLVSAIPEGPDRLASLHEELRSLEKSIRLRLGLLPIDRPQAWFRHSPTTGKGPIAGVQHEEPIFTRFEEARAASIRHLLPELWKNREVSCAAYDPSYSLWGRLLHLNKTLHQLNQLPHPFQDICVDELAEALPDELQSPMLMRFCLDLGQRMRGCRRDMDACFALLWTRSESFLYALHLHHLSQKAKAKSQDSRKGGLAGRPLSPLEEALRFMGFHRLPDFNELRQRYRQLAQSMHPDRGGPEERFKLLGQHYQCLLKQLQRLQSQ